MINLLAPFAIAVLLILWVFIRANHGLNELIENDLGSMTDDIFIMDDKQKLDHDRVNEGYPVTTYREYSAMAKYAQNIKSTDSGVK